MWGHCSFLLVQRHTRFCFCPPRVCFPSPVLSSGGSMVGLMVTSSKRAYAIRRSAAPRAPAPAAGTLQETLKTQLWLSLCGVYGSWCLQGLFEPSEHLWWIRGLIINAISPLLSSFWGFSFALGHGVSFLVGSNLLLPMFVQQQADERMSFYCTILPGTAEAKGISRKEGGRGGKSQQSPRVGAGMPVRKGRHFLQVPRL